MGPGGVGNVAASAAGGGGVGTGTVGPTGNGGVGGEGREGHVGTFAVGVGMGASAGAGGGASADSFCASKARTIAEQRVMRALRGVLTPARDPNVPHLGTKRNGHLFRLNPRVFPSGFPSMPLPALPTNQKPPPEC